MEVSPPVPPLPYPLCASGAYSDHRPGSLARKPDHRQVKPLEIALDPRGVQVVGGLRRGVFYVEPRGPPPGLLERTNRYREKSGYQMWLARAISDAGWASPPQDMP